MILITFTCGHRLSLEAIDEAPVCVVCGTRRVRAVSAPPPRIRIVDCAAESPLAVKE